MKKNTYIILLIFVLIFVAFVNYKNIFYAVYIHNAAALYRIQNYTGSLDNIEKAHKYADTTELDFFKGLNFFGLKKYLDAQTQFSQVGSEKTSKDTLRQKALYNLGNTQYYIGEGAGKLEEKIHQYEQSITSYDQSLTYGNDQQIISNKDYVQKKLDALKNLQQQQSQTGQNSDQKDKNSQNQDASSSSQSGSTSQSTASGGLSDKSGGDTSSSLTPEEKQYLEQYEQYLQKLQSENQDAFNKPRTSGNSNDIFDIFNDPFFQDFQSQVEQDW